MSPAHGSIAAVETGDLHCFSGEGPDYVARSLEHTGDGEI